jgi:alpha-ketoglutarate-dependent taurine dioxygenase
LRGVTIPPYGGDTQWTNLVAAYEALSEPLKAFLNTLRGEHRFSPPAGANPTAEYLELIQQNTLVSEHPLITLHPETGEKILFISPGFLKTISGLRTRESRVLLELLWEHAVRSEFTVRFKWEPGSIAFWDNRSTAHVAPQDIFRSAQYLWGLMDVPPPLSKAIPCSLPTALLSKRHNTHGVTSLIVSSAGQACRGLKVLLAAPFFLFHSQK